MNIFIRGPFQQTITLQVESNAKISTVKIGLQRQLGIRVSVDEHRLYYAGKMLKNELTLSDYGIHKDATLDMS